MITLPITLVTAAIAALMLIWLSSRVIGARVKSEVLIGDQGNQELLWCARTQANFIEYTPLFLILLGLLEVMQANQIALLVMAAVFLLARVLHVLGMGPEANLQPRQLGMVGTFTMLGAASLYGLFIALV